MAPNPLTFSVDVEDHRPSDDAWPVRFPDLTRRLLAMAEQRGVRGSIFVVGEVAEAYPDLVREIAAGGHELALHGWEHVPLTELSPEVFRQHLRRGRAVLEDLTGQEVIGFRAPTASITPASAWAPDILAEEGFRYSSSVIPSRNPLFGWPGAPNDVFRWSSGIAEFPLPVTGTRTVGLPHLGGVYLRVLPWPVIAFVRNHLEHATVPGIYCHPYDIDPDEPRWAIPGVPAWGVRLLWLRRRGMLAKLARMLDTWPVGPPLAERLHEVEGAPVFSTGGVPG